LILGLSSIISFREGVKKALEIAKKLSVSHLDIFCAPKHFDIYASENVLRELRDLADSLNMSLSLKAPAFTQNIASFNDYVRDLALKQYKRCIDLCAYLECAFTTIRAGIFFYEERRKMAFALKQLVENMNNILLYASKAGVNVLVENYYLPMDVVKRTRDLQRFVTFFSHFENFGIALNMAHLINVREKVSRVMHDKKVLEKIRAVYLGPPPTPWDTEYDLSKMDLVVKMTKQLFPKLRDRTWIVASIDSEIAKKLIRILREFR